MPNEENTVVDDVADDVAAAISEVNTGQQATPAETPKSAEPSAPAEDGSRDARPAGERERDEQGRFKPKTEASRRNRPLLLRHQRIGRSRQRLSRPPLQLATMRHLPAGPLSPNHSGTSSIRKSGPTLPSARRKSRTASRNTRACVPMPADARRAGPLSSTPSRPIRESKIFSAAIPQRGICILPSVLDSPSTRQDSSLRHWLNGSAFKARPMGRLHLRHLKMALIQNYSKSSARCSTRWLRKLISSSRICSNSLKHHNFRKSIRQMRSSSNSHRTPPTSTTPISRTI